MKYDSLNEVYEALTGIVIDQNIDSDEFNILVNNLVVDDIINIEDNYWKHLLVYGSDKKTVFVDADDLNILYNVSQLGGDSVIGNIHNASYSVDRDIHNVDFEFSKLDVQKYENFESLFLMLLVNNLTKISQFELKSKDYETVKNILETDYNFNKVFEIISMSTKQEQLLSLIASTVYLYNIAIPKHIEDAVISSTKMSSYTSRIIVSLMLKKRINIDLSKGNIIHHPLVGMDTITTVFTPDEIKKYFIVFRHIDVITSQEMFDIVSKNRFFKLAWTMGIFDSPTTDRDGYHIHENKKDGLKYLTPEFIMDMDRTNIYFENMRSLYVHLHSLHEDDDEWDSALLSIMPESKNLI